MNPLKNADSVTLLLYGGIWMSVVVLIACEFFFKDDAQLFQVFASLLTGFLGAFLGRVKPPVETPPAGTLTTVSTTRVTETPPEVK